MKEQGSRSLRTGFSFVTVFAVWTALIKLVDVQYIGPMETAVGFATINGWFHKLTGVHMWLYTVTDWLGLIPVFVCLMFGGIGFVQLMQRKKLLKVDRDILLLGIYYLLVIFGYLVFEMIPINYRPILIEGIREASYPSSTTLLVLGVMPTLVFQSDRRLGNVKVKKIIAVCYSGSLCDIRKRVSVAFFIHYPVVCRVYERNIMGFFEYFSVNV